MLAAVFGAGFAWEMYEQPLPSIEHPNKANS
jgi:hypothetical protein